MKILAVFSTSACLQLIYQLNPTEIFKLTIATGKGQNDDCAGHRSNWPQLHGSSDAVETVPKPLSVSGFVPVVPLLLKLLN